MSDHLIDWSADDASAAGQLILALPEPHIPLSHPLPPACACVHSCAGCTLWVLPDGPSIPRPVCFVSRGFISGAWDTQGLPTPDEFEVEP